MMTLKDYTLKDIGIDFEWCAIFTCIVEEEGGGDFFAYLLHIWKKKMFSIILLWNNYKDASYILMLKKSHIQFNFKRAIEKILNF